MKLKMRTLRPITMLLVLLGFHLSRPVMLHK